MGFCCQAAYGYTASLTKHVAEMAAQSKIVSQQLENPDGETYSPMNLLGKTAVRKNLIQILMFSIDEDALADAFQIDESQLTGDMADAFDFSNLSVDTIH